MSPDAWWVLAVLVATLVVLAIDRVSTIIGLGAGIAVLLIVGAIDDDIALSGFASPATATIAALYVVAGAISATGALSWLIDGMLFGRRGGVGRLSTATAALSSLIPNTPLVALAAPRVVRWARRNGISPSRLLMPLSFASVLGGVVTVLGTSSNLVVSDLLIARGDTPLGVFEITPVGLPVALVGILVTALVAPRLLRERRSAAEEMRASARRYHVQMVVEATGPLAGSSIEAARLRNLQGVFLAAVERHGTLTAARPDLVLESGDLLYFVGDVSHVMDLQELNGLVSAEQPHLLDAEGPGARLYEAVVADRSDLAWSTLKESGFRSRYGGAVLAIHRSDGELRGKLGTITLHPGDVLLVLAGTDFSRRWRDFRDFSLVASIDEPPPARRNRAWVAIGAFVAMIALAASGVLSLFVASLVAAGLVVLGGTLSRNEARHAVDLSVVVIIALSISLGNAVASTGLAEEIADRLVDIGMPLGIAGLLLVTIIVTQLLTEVLSNSGAAALMVPVAMAAGEAAGGDPRGFAIGVLIGASCSFLTPIGYQTNLMVYGLGGYRFFDFTRVGFPLTLSSSIVATVMLELLY